MLLSFSLLLLNIARYKLIKAVYIFWRELSPRSEIDVHFAVGKQCSARFCHALHKQDHMAKQKTTITIVTWRPNDFLLHCSGEMRPQFLVLCHSSPFFPISCFYNGFALRQLLPIGKMGVTSILNEVRVRAGVMYARL